MSTPNVKRSISRLIIDCLSSLIVYNRYFAAEVSLSPEDVQSQLLSTKPEEGTLMCDITLPNCQISYSFTEAYEHQNVSFTGNIIESPTGSIILGYIKPKKKTVLGYIAFIISALALSYVEFFSGRGISTHTLTLIYTTAFILSGFIYNALLSESTSELSKQIKAAIHND